MANYCYLPSVDVFLSFNPPNLTIADLQLSITVSWSSSSKLSCNVYVHGQDLWLQKMTRGSNE